MQLNGLTKRGGLIILETYDQFNYISRQVERNVMSLHLVTHFITTFGIFDAQKLCLRTVPSSNGPLITAVTQLNKITCD